MHSIDVFSLNRELSLKQLKKVVMSLKQDKIAVSPKLKAFPYEKSIWYEAHSPYFLFKLQSLTMIDYLLSYYQKFHDDRCVIKALQYFYLWYEENQHRSQCKLCFHHDVIAKRLVTISRLLSTSKSLDLLLLDDIFIEVIASHVRRLVEKNDHYHYDHEIDHDLALIIASIVYNHYYIKNAYQSYIELSIKRLTEKLDDLITNDSSFLGESTQRAYQLFIRLYQLHHFLKQYTLLNDFSKYIKGKLNHLYYFLYAMTQPDAMLPPIFDSSYVSLNKEIILSYQHPLKQKFKDLFSHQMLHYESFFFQKANFVILNQKNYKLYFYNSFLNPHHKQQDNLAFCLYYHKYLLFIDGGRYNYQENNYYKNAMNKCYAHNTISVDYHDYQIDRSQINQCGIVSTLFTKDLNYACGIHTLYEELIIKRNLIILSNQMIILDELFSKENHDYEIIFNINPIFNLKTDGLQLYNGYLNHNPIFELKSIYSTMPLTTYYHYGNHKQYKGLMSRKFNHIEPCHSVIYQGKGRNEIVVTRIGLGDYQSKMSIKATKKMIEIKIDDDTYYLIRKKIYNEITKNNTTLSHQFSVHEQLNKTIQSFYMHK